MENLTAFVVEDNIDALNMLIQDINQEFDTIKVIGKATGVVDAVKQLQREQPDILFLDIMLGDGTAFDILEIIPSLSSKIIFITASDEYAIKAFKFAAIDYILKPYSTEELINSVKKVKTYLSPQKEQLNILNQLVSNPNKPPTKISLHTSEKIMIVSVNDVIRCEADNNYTTFFLEDGKSILVSKTLKYYANLLENNGFIRTHQSHLVNKQYVKEYIKSDGGYLVLHNKTTIPVSTRKKTEIIEILKFM